MKKSIILSLLCAAIINADCIKKEDIVSCYNGGLAWQDNEDINKKSLSWDNALKYCHNLAGGDWRLPNINELLSITDIEGNNNNPSLKDGFTQRVNGKFWSSTTSAKDENRAWFIDFTDGSDGTTNKTDKFLVRCVK